MTLENIGRRIGFNTPSPFSFIIILLFFQLILLGSMPLQAVAAPKGGKGMDRQMKEVSLEKIMETLTKKLELNQGQIAEVQPIMKNFLMQSKKLKKETMDGQNSSARGANRKQMDFLVQKAMDEIDVFLNDEQSGKFKELVQALNRKEGLNRLLGLRAPMTERQFIC